MKKSFLIHYDSLSVIDKMTDEQVGRLFRKMKSYHNGNDYEPNDIVVEIAFDQFRNQFDRDLKKYESVCDRNRENIKKRYSTKSTSRKSGIPKSTKSTDNDNDNDNDNNNDNNNDNDTNNKGDLFYGSTLSSTLSEFKKMRKSIRKPMTDKASELLLWELEKLAPGDNEMKVAILNKSILNCRQGVFPLKEEDKKAMQDPLLVEYERQVGLCYEAGWANDSYNEKLSEIMERLIGKYGKEEATKIRKETRKKVCG